MNASRVAPAAVIAVVALVVLWFGYREETPSPSREEVLEQDLRAGDASAAVVDEYLQIAGETPAALRNVERAYARINDRRRQLKVLRTLIVRGQSEDHDRLRAMALMLDLNEVDEAAFHRGLRWINEGINTSAASCAYYRLLVEWTRDRVEEPDAVDRAIASDCRYEFIQGQWLGIRANRTRNGADACDAVVHGNPDLVELCIDQGATPWKVSVARAIQGHERLRRLREASKEAQVTAFVLRSLARTDGVTTPEACAALRFAHVIERRKVPEGSDLSVSDQLFRMELRRFGCIK